jgi:hypothetical protein
MKIHCSLKGILIILIFVFLLINCIFGILYYLDNNSEESIKDEEVKLRERIEYMKRNFNFNNTYYMIGNNIHFYYGINNSNIPK